MPAADSRRLPRLSHAWRGCEPRLDRRSVRRAAAGSGWRPGGTDTLKVRT